MNDENDQLVINIIYHTLTDSEQKLFNRVMNDQEYKIGMLGQLVSEGLRRREKLGYFD